MGRPLKKAKERKSRRPTTPHSKPASGTGTVEAAISQRLSPIKRFLKVLGPGLITGASDDDPSGIGTYAVAGASLGFSILWTALISFPMMAAVQFMCAQIGMVTGQGLAGNFKQRFPSWLLRVFIVARLAANTINIAAEGGCG